MSIRFAAPAQASCPRLSPERARAACGMPANDNEPNGSGRPSEAMVHAALRQFAEHGLAAAQHARKQAEKAFRADDQQGFDWWLGICRALDRRMAKELDARLRNCG